MFVRPPPPITSSLEHGLLINIEFNFYVEEVQVLSAASLSEACHHGEEQMLLMG